MIRRFVCYALVAALALSAAPAFAAKKAKKNMDEQKAIAMEYAKAVDLINQHKWNAGIEGLTKVIENPATSKDLVANALCDRGSAYANKKMAAEAVADLTKGLDAKPDFTTAYYDRARALAMLNKHEDAIKDLTKAIELSKPSPIQAVYYKNRAISYAAISKYPEAKADFAKAKELDPKVKTPEKYKDL